MRICFNLDYIKELNFMFSIFFLVENVIYIILYIIYMCSFYYIKINFDIFMLVFLMIFK